MTGCILVPIVGGVIGAGLFWLALAAFKKPVPRSAGGAKLGPEEIAGKIREEARAMRMSMPIPPNRTVMPDARLSFSAWSAYIRLHAPIVRNA